MGKFGLYFRAPKLSGVTDRLILAVTVGVSTWLIHRRYRQWKDGKKTLALENELRNSVKAVKDLERKLMLLEATDLNESVDPENQVRIFMDGAYDLMHFGHMNAFRLGRSLGTHLVVGVNDSQSIAESKGTPVMNDMERTAVVKACRWVDEVVENVPYVMNDEYLEWIIKEYNIDYIVHGDDPCIVDGRDVYESARKRGKYLEIPRTEGISTTDIVGRMLLMTRSHHSSDKSSSSAKRERLASVGEPEADFDCDEDVDAMTPNTLRKHFLTTSSIMKLFGAGVKPPLPGARVVYVAGSFDLFHAGHVQILEKTKQHGDYLIVGVHDDEVVNSYSGSNLPILNQNERVLSVLGCGFVDDVLIGAPPVITAEMMATLHISEVIQCEGEGCVDGAYNVPRELGKLTTIDVDTKLTVRDLVVRINEQRTEMEARFERKQQKEIAFFQDKHGLRPASNSAGSVATTLPKHKKGKGKHQGTCQNGGKVKGASTEHAGSPISAVTSN